MTRHDRIDLSGRRQTGGGPVLCLLTALLPAALGLFPALTAALAEGFRRAYSPWPYFLAAMAAALLAGAYLAGAGLLLARARPSGALALSCGAGLAFLLLAGLLSGPSLPLRFRLLKLLLDGGAYAAVLFGQLALTVYTLVRWLRWR